MASPLVNKENKSPFIPNKSINNNNSASKISSSEIISAASRMMNKRESNNNLASATSNGCSNNNVTKRFESASAAAQENPHASFRDIKKKFENLSNAQSQVPLTPKSIIKKFEELSRDGQHQPLNGAMGPSRSASNSTSNLSMSAPVLGGSGRQSAPHNAQKCASSRAPIADQQVSGIVTDHITPKSIISKFEMLLAQNNSESQKCQVCALFKLIYREKYG